MLLCHEIFNLRIMLVRHLHEENINFIIIFNITYSILEEIIKMKYIY